MFIYKCSPAVNCVPAVELVIMRTLVGLKRESPKRAYKLLGTGHDT